MHVQCKILQFVIYMETLTIILRSVCFPFWMLAHTSLYNVHVKYMFVFIILHMYNPLRVWTVNTLVVYPSSSKYSRKLVHCFVPGNMDCTRKVHIQYIQSKYFLDLLRNFWLICCRMGPKRVITPEEKEQRRGYMVDYRRRMKNVPGWSEAQSVRAGVIIKMWKKNRKLQFVQD